MNYARRISVTLAAVLMLGQFSMNAQGQVVYGNSNSNGNSNNDDALQRGTFAIGTGFGYVNSVTNIQIDNGGTIQTGGNTGYQFHLTPTIGYFMTSNFVVGLGMDYLVNSSQGNTVNTIGSQRLSDTKLLFGPYARVYFPFGGQALFIGGVYGYGKSDTQISDGTDTQTANTTLMTFGAGPGYAIFANGRVSLDTQVKYNYGYSRSTIHVNGADQSTRTTTTAWDFVVGLHFYFNGNRN